MDVKKFREIIARRIHIEEISRGEWSDAIEECWKEEIKILTEDISSTIIFLKNDCTADEYSWISEVLEDVVTIVPNQEFVQCYKELMNKYPEETDRYKIAECVYNAETILKWEDKHGQEN